jgi:hypothetical protein
MKRVGAIVVGIAIIVISVLLLKSTNQAEEVLNIDSDLQVNTTNESISVEVEFVAPTLGNYRKKRNHEVVILC